MWLLGASVAGRILPGGEALVQPDMRLLAQKVGLQTQATQPFYDLIIVGAGPAGWERASTAHRRAAYADDRRAATGGQAGTSSRIENYLGFPKGPSGADLASGPPAGTTRLGAETLTAQDVEKVRVEDPYRYHTERRH